jgi:hypothetical protein
MSLVSRLRKKLIKLGFKPSEHDECVFYYGSTIFIVYTDDTTLLGPNKKEIDEIFKKLDDTFNIEDQGELSDYLGIKIVRNSDGIMEWSQPALIESILEDLGVVDIKTKNQPKIRNTPSLTTVILTSHEGEPDHDEPKSFNYRQVIGKLECWVDSAHASEWSNKTARNITTVELKSSKSMT